MGLGIGCAGEIRIREDDDFEQWAIEIYVKFRDTEKLQLLTGQRQSGGVCYYHCFASYTLTMSLRRNVL